MAEKVTDCELCEHAAPLWLEFFAKCNQLVCWNKDSSHYQQIVKSKRENVTFCEDYHEIQR